MEEEQREPTPEELKAALDHAAGLREDYLKDTISKNNTLIGETEALEKELDYYTKLEDVKFIKPDGDFQYEREADFGTFMKDLKIEGLSSLIKENHARVAVNNKVIANETKKIDLLLSGVDISGMSDDEIKAR